MRSEAEAEAEELSLLRPSLRDPCLYSPRGLVLWSDLFLLIPPFVPPSPYEREEGRKNPPNPHQSLHQSPTLTLTPPLV